MNDQFKLNRYRNSGSSKKPLKSGPHVADHWYYGKFTDIKDKLNRLFIDRNVVKQRLKDVGYIQKVRIAYHPEAINPDVMVTGTKGNAIITDLIKISKPDSLVTASMQLIGYRRADDWIGEDGLLFNKSPKLVTRFELLMTGGVVPWLLYRVCKLFVRRKHEN